MNAQQTSSPEPQRRSRELAKVLGSFKSEFVVVGIFSFVSNLLMLAPTLYMLQVYDRVLHSGSELTLLVVSLLTLFLFGVLSISDWSRSRVLVRAGVRLDELLGNRLFDASFRNSLSARGRPGFAAFSDLTELRQFLTGNGIFALFDMPWTPIYIGVLFLLHPMLGVLAVVFALIQAVVAAWGHSGTMGPTREASEAMAKSNAFMQMKLRNAEVIESMGMLGNLRKLWFDKSGDALKQNAVALRRSTAVASVSKFLRYSMQSLTLGAGALLVIDGQLSAGGMIAANVLMSRALAPLDLLVASWKGMLSSWQAYGRMEEVLAADRGTSLEQDHGRPAGDLVLRNVSARVEGRETLILRDINLTVGAGRVTVVLGPSGSGKSTLARVMLGIWPQVDGEVTWAGVPIKNWSREALGAHVGYLPQDIELFDGTIADNIARLGNVEPERVIRAAQMTGLHDMILRFPKGYDTPIGEAGGLLSGGQRQRIGLARAIYGVPALVILDEPNANLDDVGERALAQAVDALRQQGSSVVLISHRPSVLGVADDVVLLKAGALVEQGPRDQVLATLKQQQGALPAATQT